MTDEEAEMVAAAASTADDGCVVCVFSLASQLTDRLPDFDWFKLVGTAGGWDEEEVAARRSDDEEEREWLAGWKALHEEPDDS